MKSQVGIEDVVNVVHEVLGDRKAQTENKNTGEDLTQFQMAKPAASQAATLNKINLTPQ